MTRLPPYEVRVEDRPGYTLIEITGPFDAESGRRAAEGLMEVYARLDPPNVLFDLRGMTGVLPAADSLALLEQGLPALVDLRVATVVRPSQLLPDRAAQSAAAGHGVNLRVFTELDQAVEWLTD